MDWIAHFAESQRGQTVERLSRKIHSRKQNREKVPCCELDAVAAAAFSVRIFFDPSPMVIPTRSDFRSL
jgi:hypothetical protein